MTVDGVPIPFQSPALLAVVGLHVLLGLSCVTVGVIAILSRKGRGRHSNFGTVYFWLLSVVFATAATLAYARWREDYHLFVLGFLALAAALFGRSAMRRRWPHRIRLHILGMGTSFVVLLTAFYVDNGKNLPLWRDLPSIAYWIVPTTIGAPILIWALLRHPLVRVSRSSVTEAAK